MRFIHWFLLSVVLAFAGCKTEKLKEPSSGSSEKPQTDSEVRIEGRAGPLWVVDGLVSAHLLTAEGLDFSVNIATARTNGSGEFSLKVDRRYLGQPLVFRVVTGGAARVRCDLPAGCGASAAFGGDFSPDVPLEMVLAVSRLRGDARYSISSLSHTAFKLMEPELRRANDLAEKLNSIDRANSRVAGRLGLAHELPSLTFVDFASAAEVAQANDLKIKSSLLALAIMQAAGKTYGSSSIVDALGRFVGQYADVGLPANADAASLTSYTAVLREASAMANALRSLHSREFGGVVSGLEASMNLVMIGENAYGDRGFSSAGAGMTGAEQAKLLAADVRTLANSVDMRKLVALGSSSALLQGKVVDLFKPFGFNLDATHLFRDDQSDNISDSLGMLIEATFSALASYYSNSIIATSYEGLNFTHTVVQGTHAFGFRTSYDPCGDSNSGCLVTYDLDLVVRVVNFTGNSTTFAPGLLDFRIVGSARSSDLRINFLAADQQVRFLRPVISKPVAADEGLEGQIYRISADALRLRLPYEIVKENPVVYETMKGLLSVEVGKFSFQYTKQDVRAQEDNGSFSVVSDSVVQIDQLEGLRANFSSTVQPMQADEFRASINFTQNSRAVAAPIRLKTVAFKHCPSGNPLDCEKLSSESFIEGETAESYLGLYVSMAFLSKLKGVNTPAVLELAVSRSSPTTNNIDELKIRYPGHSVAVNGRFSNNGGILALDAVNLDGMRLYFDTFNGRRAGAVESIYRERAADIIDMGQWLKIRYADGSFESL